MIMEIILPGQSVFILKHDSEWGPSQYKDVVLPVYDPHVKDKTVSHPPYL